MVKMASIVPQNLLDFTKDADIHMALACFVGEPDYRNYTEFFQKKRKPDSFLIMDNGVIEGKPMSFEECIKRAELINADEIVLPDVYKDHTGTYNAIKEAIEYALKYDFFDYRFRFMAVPQGDSMEDWVACAEEIIRDFGMHISTIGIPKHLVDTCKERDARLIAISNLYDKVPNLGEWDIHLLGCWRTPLEVLMCTKASEQGIIPTIRSCDSAIPYVYARNGMRFSDDDRPDTDPIDFKKGHCNKILLAYNNAAWVSIGDPNAERGIYFL